MRHCWLVATALLFGLFFTLICLNLYVSSFIHLFISVDALTQSLFSRTFYSLRSRFASVCALFSSSKTILNRRFNSEKFLEFLKNINKNVSSPLRIENVRAIERACSLFHILHEISGEKYKLTTILPTFLLLLLFFFFFIFCNIPSGLYRVRCVNSSFGSSLCLHRLPEEESIIYVLFGWYLINMFFFPLVVAFQFSSFHNSCCCRMRRKRYCGCAQYSFGESYGQDKSHHINWYWMLDLTDFIWTLLNCVPCAATE